MWTSYINCVLVRNVLLRSCCGFGSLFNLAALGAITFFLHGRQADRRLDPFISFVRGNVSFLLWCGNELGETLWTQLWSSSPLYVDSFTKQTFFPRLYLIKSARKIIKAVNQCYNTNIRPVRFPFIYIDVKLLLSSPVNGIKNQSCTFI